MKTDPRLSTVRSQLKKERPNPALKCRESKMQDEDDPPQTSTARLFYAKHGFERAGDARPFQIRLDDSSIGSDEDRAKPNPLSQLLAMKSQLHHMAVAILASLALVQQGTRRVAPVSARCRRWAHRQLQRPAAVSFSLRDPSTLNSQPSTLPCPAETQRNPLPNRPGGRRDRRLARWWRAW